MKNEEVTIGDCRLILGDCREVLPTLPKVDAVVTDPPYGLSFMGKRWDYDVPATDLWALVLERLLPGGHLLAFAGTRTQHRMAVRIEDAGFEIRDMIAWVYGSGFPKSLDVSKAIDKAAGVEREVVGSKIGLPGYSLADDKGRGVACVAHGNSEKECQITAPATDAARQWQGWGTALKPALETVTFASKPFTDEQERDIIISNLIRLEARLWLLSSVSAAEKSSTPSRSEFDAACVIAQWSADEITSTRAALCDPMGTSLFELATTTSLNIVSSWRRTLVESWNDGNTSTTETKSSTTIDWRTLKFSLSQITPNTIIRACSLPGGFSVNASTAESHFNASLSLLQSIRTLSATERAISLEAESCRDVGVKPNLDPCIMARKPLTGTVAANVLAHGTGALNIDGCRVDGGERPLIVGENDPRKFSGDFKQGSRCEGTTTAGRWPANLIHDGSDEVVSLFPQSKGQQGAVSGNEPSSKTQRIGWASSSTFGEYAKRTPAKPRGDIGSAARFFYCAKAAASERGAGNDHPTVKPIALMRWLLTLVTPPGGVVLDPFLGSGSTGVAAADLGARFIGIERDRKYFDIACERIARAYDQARMPLGDAR